MSQSSFIVAILVGAFILFLAAKNRLSAYTAVLWGPTVAPLPSASSAGGSSSSGLLGGGMLGGGLLGGSGSNDSSGNQVAQLAPLAIMAFA